MSELVENAEPAKSSSEEKSVKAAEEDQQISVNGNHDISEKDVSESKSNDEEETAKGKSEEDVQMKQVDEEKMETEDKEHNKDNEEKKDEDGEQAKEEKTENVETENLKKDDADDEEDSESDEELPPGLLERPVEILQDKRERKKTSRFTYDDSPAPAEKKKFEVPDGSGIKLSQHPRVEWQLQRNKTEDLKIIHKLFFGTFGDAFTCKKNMRNFSGFPFDKESPEFEKKEDYIGRFTLDNLKWALVVCDVDNRKGKKEDLIDSLLEWCLCPKPSGKEIPVKKKKKEKSQKKISRKSVDKTSKSNSSITSDDVSDDSDQGSQEEATPKKSKPKKKPKTPKSPEKKTPKKRKSTASGGKIAKIKIGSPRKTDGGDSDDSDAPLKKKSKKVKPPTNPQIRKAVEGILKGADLEVITMKLVCMKVYALYPDFDLSDRKVFIKETVKSIIS